MYFKLDTVSPPFSTLFNACFYKVRTTHLDVKAKFNGIAPVNELRHYWSWMWLAYLVVWIYSASEWSKKIRVKKKLFCLKKHELFLILLCHTKAKIKELHTRPLNNGTFCEGAGWPTFGPHTRFTGSFSPLAKIGHILNFHVFRVTIRFFLYLL